MNHLSFMNSKLIQSWQATAAISSDDCELAVRYQDNTTGVFKNIPPPRLAALIAVLESSQASAVILDASGQPWITNSPNGPGL